MYQIMLIAFMGAIGAVGRYAVSGWAYRCCGPSFPYGTLAVNVIGCFLMGAIAHIGQATDLIPPPYRQAVTVGMLGAFTTFSTFGHETLLRLQGGQYQAGLLNIAANVLVGLAAVWGGMVGARQLFGGA